MSWQRAEALQRRLPEITRTTVPAGILDFRAGVPDRDIQTIAARATLAAREYPHAAILYLLVKAAKEIHGGPALLNAAREFPNLKGFAEIDAIIAQADLLKVPASMLLPHYELRGRLRLIRSDLEEGRARLLTLQDQSPGSADPPQSVAPPR